MGKSVFSLHLHPLISFGSLATLLCFSIIFAGYSATAATGYGSISYVDVSTGLVKGDTISIHFTNSANLSGLSIVGGQFVESSQTAANRTDLLISPINTTSYDIEMFVVGSNESFSINIWRISSTSASILLAGYSETANTIVNLKVFVNVASPTGSNSLALNSSWNPFFGLTGIKLGPITITFAEAIQILTVLSIIMVLCGIYFKKAKLGYFGAIVLGVVLFMTLGILILLVAVLSYLVGFGAISVAWRVKTRLGRSRDNRKA